MLEVGLKKMDMGKINVEKQIFYKLKDSPWTWKDIKDIPFQDDDIINLNYVESHYSENNSWDGHYHGEIIRMVKETDQQYERRIAKTEADKARSKKNRYENYLNLKKEFENE